MRKGNLLVGLLDKKKKTTKPNLALILNSAPDTQVGDVAFVHNWKRHPQVIGVECGSDHIFCLNTSDPTQTQQEFCLHLNLSQGQCS